MVDKVQQKVRFCPNEGKSTLHYRNNKEIHWLMHLVLAIFSLGIWIIGWAFVAIYHVLTKPIAGKWTCSQCGGLEEDLPQHQNAHHQQATIQPEYPQPRDIPSTVHEPKLPTELPPLETFAIDKNINGGLIEFFGLQRWYQTAFNDEQKHRLEERFGIVAGNKLASGPVRFKFANVDILQFFYGLEEKLKPQEFSDIYKLVDEQYKVEAGKFCKIDDDRWNNEKYYKSWFALMKPRIDALTKLKDDNYFKQGQFDMVNDNYATQPCLDISGKGFNILNGELDRAFDQHFFEPIEGCRCTVRGYRD